MPRRPRVFAFVLFLLSSPAALAPAQESEVPEPLAPFARLVGGAWHMGEAHQVFDWGVGGLALHGRSYRSNDEGPVLVGEGFMFHHPGQDEVRGYFTAVGMGIDLFEYTLASADDDRLVFELQTFGAMAGQFEEVWAFTDEDHFEWSLSQISEEGPVPMMAGTYERRPR